MFLTSPQPRFIESYIDFCIGFKRNNLADFFLNKRTVGELENTPPERLAAELLRELDESTRQSVPYTQHWLVDGNTVVGVGNIRHRLTPALEFFGGHIGYGVKLGHWGLGTGTALLRELLKQAPIKTALLTCETTNTASMRVMAKNGGALLDTVQHEYNGADRTAHRVLIDTGLALSPAFPLGNHAILYQAEVDGGLTLAPFKAVDEGGQIVSYYFHIVFAGETAGWIVYRVGGEPQLYFDGNIGYFIKEEHRGGGLAARACRLLGAKLARLSVTHAIITCDNDNVASRRVCQNLDAVFLELVLQKTGGGKKIKCRYRYDTGRTQ